jgi:hypothetical protein
MVSTLRVEGSASRIRLLLEHDHAFTPEDVKVLMEAFEGTLHALDLADPEYMYLDHQKKTGVRTFLGVPLLREGSPIGVVLLARSTVRPFTDKQIDPAFTWHSAAPAGRPL